MEWVWECDYKISSESEREHGSISSGTHKIPVDRGIIVIEKSQACGPQRQQADEICCKQER